VGQYLPGARGEGDAAVHVSAAGPWVLALRHVAQVRPCAPSGPLHPHLQQSAHRLHTGQIITTSLVDPNDFN